MYRLKKNIRYGIPGIPHKLLKNFINDNNLNTAIKSAIPNLTSQNYNDFQQNVLNFYNPDTIVPYSPISAKGPWIITQNGAILYDVGGYGMLGFGHSPEWCLDILKKPHVMANIMTPSIMQQKMTDILQQKIGMNRNGNCPYSHFSFLNSGSESMELATRISDIKNDNKKDKNGESIFIVLKDSFHGRTGKASALSDSSKKTYQKYLKSFSKGTQVKTVEVNNLEKFKSVYDEIVNQNQIDAVLMEPVMGEGNPGIYLSRDFYNCVREMTKLSQTDLIIDSVQAGIRGTGYLSIVDYPHLKNEEPPDMEVFSKAVSSGQYPLSILAMRENIFQRFQTGLYGNTMTGNPKALEIGYETLKRLDKQLITNIREKGKSFKNMLHEINVNFPDIVSHVTGSGLLLALHIKPEYIVDKNKGLEYICRYNGLNVIHGGQNALRFTPHFLINNQEINLIKKLLEISLQTLRNEDQTHLYQYFERLDIKI